MAGNESPVPMDTETDVETPKSTIDTRSTRGQSAKLTQTQNTADTASTSSSKGKNFLDAATEEEKRIRMRYLPNVEGIRGLHRSEIKHDLKACRIGASNDDDSAPNAQELLANPTAAASITCYNPPVLPDSTAVKKAERVKRWFDGKSIRAIEADIKSFRKTVRRTQDELNALYISTLETKCVNDTIKRDLFNHLDLIEEESEAADMGFQQILRQIGVASVPDALTLNSSTNVSTCNVVQSSTTPSEYDQDMYASKAHWIVPGDVVRTPYGIGNVDKVSRSTMTTAPKIMVKLSFGTAFLSPSDVAVVRKHNWVNRWKNIVSAESSSIGVCCTEPVEMSSVIMGGFDDVSQDLLYPTTVPHSVVTNSSASSVSSSDDNDDTTMEVNSDAAPEDRIEMDDMENVNVLRERLVPFGDALLPAFHSRESLIFVELELLQSQLQKYLFENPHREECTNLQTLVPSRMRDWEKSRGDMYKTKALVLQKRNQLETQRQIAQLNSKALSVSNDRLEKHMSLATEMQADLDSLRERFAAELVELDVSPERVEDMIAAHLRAREQQRPKKKRKGADKEMKDHFVPRISRRKAEELKQASNNTKSEDDSHSVGDTDETSSTGPRRAPKRGRGINGDDESISTKSKRSYNRR